MCSVLDRRNPLRTRQQLEYSGFSFVCVRTFLKQKIHSKKWLSEKRMHQRPKKNAEHN